MDSGLGKDVVVRLWRECGQTLGVPAGRLRPTDRFDRELRGLDKLQITEDGVSHLLKDAAITATRAGEQFDAAAVDTLDDFIRRLAEIERHRM